MTDITQILLVVVVLTLTIVLTIIGIQFALILKEVRRTIEKVGPILDNVAVEQGYINDILTSVKKTTDKVNEATTFISDSVAQPLSNVMGIVKGVSGFVSGIKKIKRTRKEE